ncbi:MAG: pyruvate, water dikinase [Parcubacteria bacterium C7867-008]|nr:MAG: pyruvate, water dikinase [Parcubacteria bacterium C7867-008]
MRAGGKADSLKKIRSAGLNVPPFIVCGPTWSLDTILTTVQKELPEVQYFAVRSSGAQEDSKKQSFAGQFYSAVGVSFSDISNEVSNVRTSFGEMEGSVIIQEFIASDYAGVLFTRVGGDVSVLNAIEGLCLPVVNGESCDEYICAEDGTLQSVTIPEEKEAMRFREGRMVHEKRSGHALTSEQISKVLVIGRQLEQLFGCPQDIEWCFRGEELYILQSRPITKGFIIEQEIHFDSANIAESYSGIVLPLTCTFASTVYEQVYKDLLIKSGISSRKVEQHSTIFENLLAFSYGRMYYNMNNWYRMAEFAPGYKRNKQNFERMITSSIQEDVSRAIRPHWSFIILYPWIIAWKIMGFDYTCWQFKTKVTKHLRDLRVQDFEKLEYASCIQLFDSINQNLLRRWYVTVENDFFVMTYLGILGKLLNEKELQESIIFPSKATEQIQALVELSNTLSGNSEAWKAVESNDPNSFGSVLQANPELQKSLDEYLDIFGGRFANELKLESVDVDEDVTRLFALLKAYRTHELKTEQQALATPKSLIVRMVLSVFKKHAGRREEFRLLRSNTFAMARKLFKRMGHILTEERVLLDEKDVFYLHLSELMSAEAPSNYHLKDVVAKRKDEYSQYADVHPPAYFSSRGGRPPAMEIQNTTQPNDKTIYGKPASPGIVSGKVRVFGDFHIPNEIDFDILITSHTDPGWTPLIALSKGLIIEHGGVLSHASIVARELGVPAVIGISNAMQIFKDGQEVRIDGSTGSITVL